MTQDRAGIDPRAAVFAQIRGIDHVRRHQINGAFDALIGAANGARDGAQQRGLANANIAFEQNVAATEHGQSGQADNPGLADYGRGDGGLKIQGRRPPVLKTCLRV